MPPRTESVLLGLMDVDLDWALVVVSVMLANERNTVTKHAAVAALGMTDLDYDTWRRRFATFGREMFLRLNTASRR